jgi:endonuclease/exonuclease/phosphatase family metal-dependent hydrolase
VRDRNGTWPAPPGRAPGTLRVASVNLWGLFGDWDARRALLLDGWGRIDADVAVLQEARLHGAGDQARDLQLAFDFPYAARDPRAAAGEEHEGVAILARCPLRHVESFELPLHRPARLAVQAEVSVGGGWVTMVAAHTSVEPAEVLDAQLRLLFSLTGEPLLLVGDLNAEPDLVQPLAEQAGLDDALGFADMPTWPVDIQHFREGWTAHLGREPWFEVRPRRLDYVLSRGVRVLGAGTSVLGDPQRGYASDHAIVWADLDASSAR